MDPVGDFSQFLGMGAAEVALDFDLELKKKSSLAAVLDKSSFTFHWML